MRGIIESGGELTPRQSSYAKEGGWLGFAHWVRDKILTPLLPVPPDPPDSISGDEFKLPFNITTAANTTLVPPQSFNIEVLEIFIYVVGQNTIRLFVDAIPQTAPLVMPDKATMNVPPFTLQAGRAVVLNTAVAGSVVGAVRYRYVQPLGHGTV